MIPVSKPWLGAREMIYTTQAINSGWVSSAGPFIEQFEAEFASYCGTKYALAVSSGTAALHLALLASGIGPGDEVIIPDLTFVATANAVSYTGATPVFVDINSKSLCLSAETIRAHLTEKTKAIIPVHLFGHPADMDAINGLAYSHGLKIIEDACEAHGASYKGTNAGALGDVGCFSFYGNKIITTGEGGMLTTDDPEIYAKAKHLRGHAQTSKRYEHDQIGYNYRMTNVQAAIGCAQLDRIDEILSSRARLHRMYSAAIPDRVMQPEPWARSVHWMVSIQTDYRDAIAEILALNGVDTRPFFRPLSTLAPYRRDSLNWRSWRASQRGLCLPTHHEVSEADVLRIAGVINTALRDVDKSVA